MTRAQVEAEALVGFTSALEYFGEPWTLSRPSGGTVDPDTGAPLPGAPTTSQVTLTLSWRTGQDPFNYREDSAGAVKAVIGTLRAGDALTHPTHGKFVVQEEGPKAYLGYERAEIKRAS